MTISTEWVKRKYFHSIGNRHWVFAAPVVRKDGSKGLLDLYQISGTDIRRHRKVKGEFNLFDPLWEQYSETLGQARMEYSMRYRKQWVALYKSQGGLCAHCGWALTDETGWHDHHLNIGCMVEPTLCPTGFCYTPNATGRHTLVNLQ